MAKVFILAVCLTVTSCTRVHSVQLHPPKPAPVGLISGYGIEKLSGNAERARQTAYLKAMDDLLRRIDVKPVSRSLDATFRSRATRMLQPDFQDSGVDHGFVWVLLATTEDEIQRGWQQFVEWRTPRIDQAQKLFQEAKGQERLSLLQAAMALLEEAGAANDPILLYSEVKAALDSEVARAGALGRLQKDFRRFMEDGQLTAAEAILGQAQDSGLSQSAYQQCTIELSDRRDQAMQLIAAGDDLLRRERYKEARARYEAARKLDRDNSLVPGKIAMTDRFEHEAHARHVREAISLVVPVAARTLGEYFEFKKEEEKRKREEAERAAEEARREEQEGRPRGPRMRRH